MTTCAFCGSEKTPVYCFGDGQPICHECHTTLPNTIAACRHEIVKLRKDRSTELKGKLKAHITPEIPK